MTSEDLGDLRLVTIDSDEHKALLGSWPKEIWVTIHSVNGKALMRRMRLMEMKMTRKLETREDIDNEIARLQVARLKAPTRAQLWPKTVSYFLHGEKENNWSKGEEIGLSEEAIRDVFRGCCYEIELTLQVSENGTAVATHLDGVALTTPVPVATAG